MDAAPATEGTIEGAAPATDAPPHTEGYGAHTEGPAEVEYTPPEDGETQAPFTTEYVEDKTEELDTIGHGENKTEVPQTPKYVAPETQARYTTEYVEDKTEAPGYFAPKTDAPDTTEDVERKTEKPYTPEYVARNTDAPYTTK